MISKIQGKRGSSQPVRTEKVRSLLQLKRALREEVYEVCSFWIDEAMQYGATKKEISRVLKNPSWHVESEPASMN
jgi:hypothetical protein